MTELDRSAVLFIDSLHTQDALLGRPVASPGGDCASVGRDRYRLRTSTPVLSTRPLSTVGTRGGRRR